MDGAATVAALNRARAESMSPLRAWSWANCRSVRSSPEEKVDEEFEEFEEEEEGEKVVNFFIPALSALE